VSHGLLTQPQAAHRLLALARPPLARTCPTTACSHLPDHRLLALARPPLARTCPITACSHLPDHRLLALARPTNPLSPCESLTATRKRGDFVGEIALVYASMRTADVIAADDVEAYALSRPQFLKVAKRYPKIFER